MIRISDKDMIQEFSDICEQAQKLSARPDIVANEESVYVYAVLSTKDGVPILEGFTYLIGDCYDSVASNMAIRVYFEGELT